MTCCLEVPLFEVSVFHIGPYQHVLIVCCTIKLSMAYHLVHTPVKTYSTRKNLGDACRKSVRLLFCLNAESSCSLAGLLCACARSGVYPRQAAHRFNDLRSKFTLMRVCRAGYSVFLLSFTSLADVGRSLYAETTYAITTCMPAPGNITETDSTPVCGLLGCKSQHCFIFGHAHQSRTHASSGLQRPQRRSRNQRDLPRSQLALPKLLRTSAADCL